MVVLDLMYIVGVIRWMLGTLYLSYGMDVAVAGPLVVIPLPALRPGGEGKRDVDPEALTSSGDIDTNHPGPAPTARTTNTIRPYYSTPAGVWAKKETSHHCTRRATAVFYLVPFRKHLERRRV